MTENGMSRLAGELKRWAERPSSVSPRAARTRVLAGLPRRRRRPVWRLVTGGAALASAALVVALVIGRRSEPVVWPPPTVESAQPTIVHQLSSGTKLYIVMRAAEVDDKS